MAVDDDQGEVGDREVPLSDDLIGADMPCLRCGYNLRGLKPVGQCPECGSRIEKTVEYVMARIMCPVCMGPNHPTAAICVHCKSPISGAAATATYWKMMPVIDRRGRPANEEDEPEAPSAVWAFMCGAFGLFLMYLGVGCWAALLTRGPQDVETRLSVLVGQMLVGMLLIFLSGLAFVLPTRQYLRLRREYQVKFAAWKAREEAKNEAAEECAASRKR